MSKLQGSVLGGSLLIGGSCIGAGMLGMPIQTGLAGFAPSFIVFFIVWAFMTLTGLLLIEVNGWFAHHVNLLTMTSHILGRTGRFLCWVLYLFLLYALLVAYTAASGNILSHFLSAYVAITLPPYLLSILFVILFGILTYAGTRAVDLTNRVLMMFKIGFFILVFLLCIQFIDPKLLVYTQPSKMLGSLPILITAFGYHNMIPSLTSYMKGNMKKVRLCILLGSLGSFVVYIFWQMLILGIIPLSGPLGLQASLKEGKEASQILSQYLSNSGIGIVVQLLGFVAILTSFLAQSLSLSHFLADGLDIKYGRRENIGVCFLTLFPPLMLAIFYPQVFYAALDFAGGICTVCLFGVLPALMVWKGRSERLDKPSATRVPGGKILLAGILSFAFSVFGYELYTLGAVIWGS